MSTTRIVLVLGAVAMGLMSTAAAARPGHRHRHVAVRHVYPVRHVYGDATFGYAGPFGYYPVVFGPYPAFGQSYDGQIVDQTTRRAQSEPGVTSELASDARQTATGGPVGGIPGQSGGP